MLTTAVDSLGRLTLGFFNCIVDLDDDFECCFPCDGAEG